MRSYPRRALSIAFLGFVLVFGVPLILIPVWDTSTSRDFTNKASIIAIETLVSFGGVAGILWTFWAFIEASADGLRWRGGTAQWAEVTDYYLKLPESKRSQPPQLTVELRNGKRLRLSRDWANYKELQAIIEKCATNAKVSSWGIYGARLEDDWPRRFDYHTLDNRFQTPFILGLGSVMVMLAIYRVYSTTVRFHVEMGWVWTLSLCLVTSVVLLSLPTLFAFMILPLQREVRKRGKHTLTLTRDGLIFTDEKRRIAARWDEVQGYAIRFFKPTQPRYVVATKNGDFDFLPLIKDRRIVEAFIARMAPGDGVWRREDPVENLAPVTDAAGKRIHHYHTRTNRALLGMALLFGTAPFLGIGVQSAFGLSVTFPVGVLVLFGAFIPAAFWGFWRYKAARIEVDDEGIAQIGLSGRRSLRWSDATAFQEKRTEPLDFDVVSGGATQIRYWYGISDVEALRAQIRRRITPA